VAADQEAAMTEPLNLTHLRSLVAVVDRKSFTRAAQVLHLSQSTVSQHVRLLERRVGIELFVRAQRGVKLTPRVHRSSRRGAWADSE
jgi:DNA-binding transcriptional LysR family regulator